jgi:preprotein translocase subunit YajC
MLPIFFIFPFLSAFIINKIKNNIILFLILLISIIPGFLFFNLYLNQDSRIQASQWISSNLKTNSTILSETGNVINLPINQL